MENYESLGTIGEGTYGVVLKCRHKVTGQIVAIKKFKESDDDEQVKKTALREIKILKQLKHENIVSLLEVFRVKGKLYLVFEYVEKTILEEIEKNPEGLDPLNIKRLMWQLVRAIHFCHQHNIIHRDIKPENLLVSRNGVLKLCDFGFARPLAGAGAKYTEYVSTRWYRAPELLVGDVSYGKAVDVWSIGCMFAEIATGLPLFPGDSDIDQLYHIIKCLGAITPRQQELFKKNSLYVGVKLPHATEREPLTARFPQFDKHSLDLLHQTIKDEPLDRWTCAELLRHPYFENANELFEQELQDAIQRDLNDTMSLRKKRTRAPKPTAPPSRGTGLPAASGSVGNDEFASGEYYATNPTQALKPSFKPMAAAPPAGAVAPSKDKPHVVVPKKPAIGLHGFGGGLTPSGGGASGGGGGLVLPTLSSMTPSSSSTSTVSIDSTATLAAMPSTSTPQSTTMGSKKPGSVLPLASTQPDHGDSHAFYAQHAPPPRVSLTSHGARPTIPAASLYPSSVAPSSPFNSSLAMPQRPLLPSSHGKTGASSNATGGSSTPNGAKHLRVFPAGALKASKPVAASTATTAATGGSFGLQSSMEIYSPAKKSHAASTNSSSSSSSSYGSPFHGSKKTVGGATGGASSQVAPLHHHGGYQDNGADYVPPKTSHGGAGRRTHAHAVSPAAKQRRADNDSYRNY